MSQFPAAAIIVSLLYIFQTASKIQTAFHLMRNRGFFRGKLTSA
jgi:hypothetical protein